LRTNSSDVTLTCAARVEQGARSLCPLPNSTRTIGHFSHAVNLVHFHTVSVFFLCWIRKSSVSERLVTSQLHPAHGSFPTSMFSSRRFCRWVSLAVFHYPGRNLTDFFPSTGCSPLPSSSSLVLILLHDKPSVPVAPSSSRPKEKDYTRCCG
jgi:hypothetical protein